jgi:hypothetical protein
MKLVNAAFISFTKMKRAPEGRVPSLAGQGCDYQPLSLASDTLNVRPLPASPERLFW